MESSDSEELLSIDSSDDEDFQLPPSKKKAVEKVDNLGTEASVSSSDSLLNSLVNGENPISPLNDKSESDLSDEEDSAIERSLSGPIQSTEVTLSDDEEEEANDGAINGESSSLPNEVTDADRQNTGRRYGLRRKQKVNYNEIENGQDLEGTRVDKQTLKKEVFDVFALPIQKITRFTQKPELIDNYTRCKICFMDGTDTDKINLVKKLFEKCGNQFESLFIQIRYDVENFEFLKSILTTTTALGKLDYRYHHKQDASHLLEVLKGLRLQKHLQSFHSLKLVSINEDVSLSESQIAILADIEMNFVSLELGDYLWEDVKVGTIEKLLRKSSSSLESLIIHGGFIGDTDKSKILITFPKMEKLTTLCICPSYTFQSEIQNPYSKKARIITLGGNREETYKISIKFSETPALKRLVLGNLIDIEDLLFSSLRKLNEFKCGSYWNLSLNFPKEGSRKALIESNVTELQFPDALKDPSFTVKVAKHFPNLKKVWIFLPSVPVLRAFFKAFENSSLEELYLKTQFDFESTMESCLLPNLSERIRPATRTILETLKEYKHFDEYVRYYNVELPVQEDDLMEGHSAGIRSLKKLKVLHLEHIPRQLLIPIPDDERKWYDHNCKFMSSTFGYERYPFNYRCHKEILALDLSEYVWKNIQIDQEYTYEFYEAGFVAMPAADVQVIQDFGSGRYRPVDTEEEDIFVPVQKSKTSKAQVKIMPSMLFPDVKIKPEGC